MSGPQLDIDSIEAWAARMPNTPEFAKCYALCREVRQLRQALAAVEKVCDEYETSPQRYPRIPPGKLRAALGAAGSQRRSGENPKVTPAPQETSDRELRQALARVEKLCSDAVDEYFRRGPSGACMVTVADVQDALTQQDDDEALAAEVERRVANDNGQRFTLDEVVDLRAAVGASGGTSNSQPAELEVEYDENWTHEMDPWPDIAPVTSTPEAATEPDEWCRWCQQWHSPRRGSCGTAPATELQRATEDA